jgi:hypothetical protein
MLNDWRSGKGILNDAFAAFRSLNDTWGIALCASYLGAAYALEGAEDEARPLMLDGRTRFKALGDEWGVSVSSHYLGSLALRHGDFASARELTTEMLVNARATGDTYRISRTLYQLAEIDLAQGRPADAARALHESLLVLCEQRRLGDASQLLRLLARAAQRLGENDVAARLAGAAQHFGDAERTMPPDEPGDHEALLSRLRDELDRRYDVEFAAGAALSLEQATALGAALAARSD